MSSRGGDELEDALLQVRALIESTVALHRDRSLQESLITGLDSGYEAVLDQAQQLIASATQSIDIVHARRLASEERSDRSERELIYDAQDGVSVRLLSSHALLDEDYVREQLGREHPVAIRIARVPPLQALIVDGSAALVVAESAVGRRASLIRVPELLNTLQTLFENMWVRAVPAGERMVFGDRYRATLARQILGALQTGVTDEVAARELTISVRTYRRHVAEIMTVLGANSRFQAGVRAAELGLLPPAAGPGTEYGGSLAFS
ncbi:LuxR family transcriptional regulator [Streptomyces sp. WAC 01529]|uniref:TrmB family transcriptional regulator sugar-binding domain-containing protein n=1 Tax=Streptomyces sp. WAC 01529 TaxID=2203205 RepID=UPI000F7107B5|nr:TrmB family transcriptional regulator sugar-binding domain-containing protein [Streptomyces sp. WAC 01529]AZM56531.1 LuxR family transcriptional regulator [Streptomyces sp. WAC 01529]